MQDDQRPDWLIEIQSRSWEPEILISGITLTSLFLLSNHIYNVFGTLIQEHDVLYIQMAILFGISTAILTGLKLVLIAHLVLRGLWTGLVGLSYVYPDGIQRQKLSESDRVTDFPSPSELVIKIEKVCSVLFSFIFTSFSFFITIYVLYFPTILIRFVMQNRTVYFYINIFYFLIIIPLFVAILARKFKYSKIKMMLKANLFKNIYLIFVTNIGRAKLTVIFVLYFAAIIALSLTDVLSFGFSNKSSDLRHRDDIVLVDYNEYESSRDTNLRIGKATVSDFEVESDHISLFVSYYKQDENTLQLVQKDTSLIKAMYPHVSASVLGLPDLYRVQIDTTLVVDVPWYRTRKMETGQQGFFATIDIDSLPNGYHEVRIDKLVWRRGRKKPKLVEYWGHIPFEKRTPPGVARLRSDRSAAIEPKEK